MKRTNPTLSWLAVGAAAVALAAALPALADGGVTFRDFAADPASGIVFTHVESPRNAILDQMKQQPFVFPFDLAFVPHKPHGAPGVALLDFDRDGDLDIYVTNSLGGANGLFSSQLRQTGQLSFVDVAAAAGVDAVDHDSTGVCYGDLDNDGDHDLMVLGAIMPNRLYENQGDGTFVDITAQAGVGGGNLSTSSCSMGDVDGDGLLDIAVANTHTSWNDLLGIVVPYQFNEHNQLFVNQGGNVFADVSAASGFETLAGFPPFAAGSAALTWAIALVDFDLDGDVDAITLDDQGGVPHPFQGGVNYGIIHLHVNDGTGHFTDRTVEAGLTLPGNWMGVAFGDLDCDGHMDFFGTNVGDYPGGGQPRLFPVGVLTSRWFLGQADGSFADPGVGDLEATVFGWGVAVFDYDNDGDSDIVYHGAIDVGVFVDASNPGVVFQNQGCTASFVYDGPALADAPGASDHTRRVGQGLAAGDLDEDGFVDVVTVANATIPQSMPLTPRTDVTGSPFDATAFFLEVFSPQPPNPPNLLFWNGNFVVDGDLAVELSSGGNGNRSAAVDLLGTIGLTSGGRVNRDGIGAVVTFSTPGGKRQMVPVVGGASYASQDSLTAHFGLGTEKRGTVEVLWPGGVRNRLRDVRAGERILFPEIPCSLSDAFADRAAYVACVHGALDELVAAGILDGKTRARFLSSALAAD